MEPRLAPRAMEPRLAPRAMEPPVANSRDGTTARASRDGTTALGRWSRDSRGPAMERRLAGSREGAAAPLSRRARRSRDWPARAMEPRLAPPAMEPPLAGRAMEPPLARRAMEPPLARRAMERPLAPRAIEPPLSADGAATGASRDGAATALSRLARARMSRDGIRAAFAVSTTTRARDLSRSNLDLRNGARARARALWTLWSAATRTRAPARRSTRPPAHHALCTPLARARARGPRMSDGRAT